MTSRLLRDRSKGHARVAFVELFFDLVFVFAVTQLSHLLLHHLTLQGALETLVLLLAVWWAWIYTSWVTNWLDPEHDAVRLVLFVLMLLGLLLAASIPQALDARGLWFAGAYVASQVGRSLFMVWALSSDTNHANYRNFIRITAWLALSGVLWIAGALQDGSTRLVIWAIAMAIEVASPALGFWTPGLGRSTTADWDVDGGHMAERCGLFIIIALGESLLVTGATFAELAWTPVVVAAFAVAFVGTVAMWWIYFNVGAERASRLIAGSSDPGRHARLAYTYLHILIVAGIILAAVADKIVLEHPLEGGGWAGALVVVAGPALFILGCLLFKMVTAGWPPLSHMVGLGLLAVVVAAGPLLDTLTLAGLTAAALAVVALWETLSLSRSDASETGSGHAESG